MQTNTARSMHYCHARHCQTVVCVPYLLAWRFPASALASCLLRASHGSLANYLYTRQVASHAASHTHGLLRMGRNSSASVDVWTLTCVPFGVQVVALTFSLSRCESLPPITWNGCGQLQHRRQGQKEQVEGGDGVGVYNQYKRNQHTQVRKTVQPAGACTQQHGLHLCPYIKSREWPPVSLTALC